MAQKGQKQEGMLCGEVSAVCVFHTQGYCTISLHLAAAVAISKYVVLKWIELSSR